MNRNINIIIASLSLLTLSSCTKVVDLDLKSAHPQYVIEGNISNAEAPGYVRITRSVNFNEEGSYPAVGNARVIISDDMGRSDTLKQTTPGYYSTSLQGIPGHTYGLSVLVDGKTFTASSTMPQQVAMDTLYALRESPFGEELTTPYIEYQDPKGSAGYYNFIVYKNDNRSRNLFIANDLFDDGLPTSQALRDFDSSYEAGDRIAVEMQSISKEMYDYYFSLQATLAQSAATPANPVRIIRGEDVMGYFSAHTSQKRAITIQGL
jgi:hypothetical protein